MRDEIRRCKICGQILFLSLPFETICSSCKDLREAQKNQADAALSEKRTEQDEEWRKIDSKHEVEHGLKLVLEPGKHYENFYHYSTLYPVLLEWAGSKKKREGTFFEFKTLCLKHGVSPEIFYEEPSYMADGILWKRTRLADGSPGIRFDWDCETPEQMEIQRKGDELERRQKERSANRIFVLIVAGLILLAWLYFR